MSNTFVAEFVCKGPRIPKTDKDGEEIYQLYRILNKCTDGGVDCYEVQYWEPEHTLGADKDAVFLRAVADIERGYRRQAADWEKCFGTLWASAYPGGRLWQSPTPPNQLTLPTPKRTFSNSPVKAQNNSKKQKSIFDIDSNSSEELTNTGKPMTSTSAGLIPKSAPTTTISADSLNRIQDDTSLGEPETEDRPLPQSPQADIDNEVQHQSSQEKFNDDVEESDDSGLFGGPIIAYAESQAELDNEEEPDVQPSQPRPSNGQSAYDVLSSRFIKAHDNSLDALLAAAIRAQGMPCDGWLAKRQASETSSWKDLSFTLWLMLQSWDPEVLKHFTYGDIPKEESQNDNLKKKLRKLMNVRNPDLDDACPCTYAQYLVDKTTGESPTPKILKRILDDAELYMTGLGVDNPVSHHFALQVDTQTGSKKWGKNTVAKGERRYLESGVQAAKCKEWIDNVRERLEDLDEDVPLERPLVEVGYATNPTTRLDQHRKHSSSNYLMNLAEAICTVKYQQFGIRQYVVHHLVHEHHAMYDEIIASRIGLAYTSQGGGFCHFVAGRSHGGSHKMPRAYFKDMQEKLSSDINFITRVEKSIGNIEEHVQLYANVRESLTDVESYTLGMLDMDVEMEEAVAAIQDHERDLRSQNTMMEDMVSAVMAFEAEESED